MVILNILFFAFFFGTFTVISIEAIQRNNRTNLNNWKKSHKDKFFLNVAVFVAFLIFMTAIFNSLLVAFIFVDLLWFLLVSVSYFKFAARNEPLYFSDLFLAFKVVGVAGTSNIIVSKQIKFCFLLEVISILLLSTLNPLPALPHERVMLAIISVLILFSVSFEDKSDFTYASKGFIYGLFLNFLLYFDKPKRCAVQVNMPAIITAKTKPNIVVILSESFFDITRIQNLKLSMDPLPFYRSIKEKSLNGTLLVTPFGGGTCSVEAELLTGIAARHFNITKPFYYSVAEKPISTLPSHLKTIGYSTCALHTYYKTFYNRDKVFKNMGFDNFYGLEDLKSPKKDGLYVSDKELTSMIKKEILKKNSPSFVFGISMENHQPYTAQKYKKTSVKIENTSLEENLKKEVEAYIHTLTHVDRELKELVYFLEKQKEPTLLLFFGDHLGALGHELEFYRKIGYISENMLSSQDILSLYSPDFLIWSNYEEFSGRYDYIGANFLPKLLLDCAKLPKTGLFSFLDNLFKDVYCLSRSDIYIDSKNNIYTELPDKLKKLEELYKIEEYKAMNLLLKRK